ncbi:MAG: TonB-dependent receptor [Notoacmeibacter sp.]|nr:TonB-dependent receptor [Notoacmeibacter sp.]
MQSRQAPFVAKPVLPYSRRSARTVAILMGGTILAMALAGPLQAQTAQSVVCNPETGAGCEEIAPAVPPDETGDELEVRKIEVSAEAPAAEKTTKTKKPRPKLAAAPAPAVDTTVADNAEAGNGAAKNADSRFARRPGRVQERTTIGRLSVDTPLNGTSISSEELELVRSSDAENDILRRVPGVSMIRNLRIPTGGKGYTNNLMDGFSVRSQTLGKFGFLDEVNLWDVEAVEITRGPASVLYSSKAVGGTINVISRKPPKTNQVRVFGEGGSYGFARFGLNAAGPVNSDGSLGYSFSANALSDDGWRERTSTRKKAASGKLVWTPSDNTEVTARFEWLDLYQEHAGKLTQAQFDANWRQAQYNNLYEDTRFATFTLGLKHRFEDASTLELAYGFQNAQGIDACPSGCSSRIASLREVEVDNNDHSFRALHTRDFDTMDGRLNIGVDAFKATKKDDAYARRDFTRGALASAYTIDEFTAAPFAQYEFTPVDKLRFTLGTRWENYWLTVDDRSPTTNADGSKHYSDLVNKAGLTWEHQPNHLFWASAAQGFFVPSTSDTITSANAKPLPPERSWTFSAGLRGEFLDGRFGYDVGYYHSTITGQSIDVACGGNAVLCPDDPTGTYPAAAGKVRYQGVESSVYWRVNDWLRFDVAHTYARNRFLSFVTTAGDYSGMVAPASPEHHLNLRAKFNFLPQWTIETEIDAISSYFTNETNTNSYQRPVLVNLRTQYRFNETAVLWGEVQNLFDAKYAKRVSATNDAIPVRGYSEGYEARTFRGGLSFKF